MNHLWIQDTSISPSFDEHNKYETSNIDNTGCPSRVHFGNTAYTLGFGHLFSGNLQYCQSFDPIRQCYESCSIEIPECYSNSCHDTSPMNNNQSKQDPTVNQKVTEAMETIRNSRKNVEKHYNYFMSSVPCQYNPVTNNCHQNNITKAAAILERAANAMSTAANTQNHFRL